MHCERILCPIDFSDFSVSAYEYALTIADYYKAPLAVLHAIESWKYPYADYAGSSGDFADFSKALCEGGSRKLKDFVKQHWRLLHVVEEKSSGPRAGSRSCDVQRTTR